jgi:hypothetical protein
MATRSVRLTESVARRWFTKSTCLQLGRALAVHKGHNQEARTWTAFRRDKMFHGGRPVSSLR